MIQILLLLGAFIGFSQKLLCPERIPVVSADQSPSRIYGDELPEIAPLGGVEGRSPQKLRAMVLGEARSPQRIRAAVAQARGESEDSQEPSSPSYQGIGDRSADSSPVAHQGRRTKRRRPRPAVVAEQPIPEIIITPPQEFQTKETSATPLEIDSEGFEVIPPDNFRPRIWQRSGTAVSDYGPAQIETLVAPRQELHYFPETYFQQRQAEETDLASVFGGAPQRIAVDSQEPETPSLDASLIPTPGAPSVRSDESSSVGVQTDESLDGISSRESSPSSSQRTRRQAWGEATSSSRPPALTSRRPKPLSPQQEAHLRRIAEVTAAGVDKRQRDFELLNAGLKKPIAVHRHGSPVVIRRSRIMVPGGDRQ